MPCAFHLFVSAMQSKRTFNVWTNIMCGRKSWRLDCPHIIGSTHFLPYGRRKHVWKGTSTFRASDTSPVMPRASLSSWHPCDCCGKVLESAQSLAQHSSLHGKEVSLAEKLTFFSCLDCDSVFCGAWNEEDWRLHLGAHKAAPKPTSI